MSTIYRIPISIGAGIAFVYWMCVLAHLTLAIADAVDLPTRGGASAAIFVCMLATSVTAASYVVIARLWR